MTNIMQPLSVYRCGLALACGTIKFIKKANSGVYKVYMSPRTKQGLNFTSRPIP